MLPFPMRLAELSESLSCLLASEPNLHPYSTEVKVLPAYLQDLLKGEIIYIILYMYNIYVYLYIYNILYYSQHSLFF